MTKVAYVIKAAQKVEIANFLLALLYDLATGNTRGILIGDDVSRGAESSNISSLGPISAMMQFCDQLKAEPWSVRHPCWLPTLLLQNYNIRCQAYLTELGQEVKKIEYVNGVVYAGTRRSLNSEQRRALPKKYDLLSQMIESHAVLMSLVFAERCTMWLTEATLYITEEVRSLSDSNANAFPPSTSNLVMDGLKYIRSASGASTKWTKTYTERIRIQIDFVSAGSP